MNKPCNKTYEFQEYDNILKNSLIGILYLEENRKIKQINTRLEEIFGYSNQELPGKSSEVFHLDHEHFERFGREYYQGLKLNNVHIEWPFVTKSGDKIHCRVTGQAVDQNNLSSGIIWLFEDVTERKEAENSLKKSEEKYRTLLETADDLIVLHDLEGQITYVNDFTLEITGYTAEDIHKLNIMDLVCPDFHETINHNISKRRKSISRKRSYRIQIFTKSGEKIWLDVRSSGMKTNGEISSILIIARDISELIHSEEIMLEKNRELESAMIKAEESDKLKSAFLANMSHEIRTPMNAIIGFSNMLQDTVLDADTMNEYIEVIKNSGKQLLDLIDDIVDFSKIESGNLQLDKTQCNVTEILDSILQKYNNPGYLAYKTDLIMERQIPKALENLILYTDPYRLQQVLDNFMSNAVKHTEKGKISLSYNVVTDKIILSVKDTGVGILQSDQAMIFERFYQANDDSFKEGTGLGLSISKGIADLLGGKIYLISEPGKGSEFLLELPYVESDQDIENSNKDFEANGDVSLSDLKIYIAEDDENSYRYLYQLVRDLGADITRAENGLVLLGLIEKEKPDVILLDLKMPEMDGFEFMREYRDRNYTIPVIAQTAYVLADEKAKVINAGCRGYVSKPIDKDLLLKALVQVLQ